MTALYHPTLDVYRVAGNAVTVSPEQCQAVMRALDVWAQIRTDHGYWNRWPLESVDRKLWDGVVDRRVWRSAEISKSRLLGRLLYEGKPPLAEPPPVIWSEPRYDLVEGGDPT